MFQGQTEIFESVPSRGSSDGGGQIRVAAVIVCRRLARDFQSSFSLAYLPATGVRARGYLTGWILLAGGRQRKAG